MPKARPYVLHALYVLLERITDGKVKTEGVLEAWNVEVAAFARIVGSVNAYAQVGAQHKHIHIKPDTHACAEGKLVEEVLQRDFATRAVVVFLEQPHITSVEEKCAFKIAKYGETKFAVSLKLESTCLVVISIRLNFAGIVAARTYGAHWKRTHRVGTADIELGAVRHF